MRFVAISLVGLLAVAACGDPEDPGAPADAAPDVAPAIDAAIDAPDAGPATASLAVRLVDPELDLGIIPYAATTTATFELQNDGSVAIGLTATHLEEPVPEPAWPFSLGATTCGTALAAGARCQITVVVTTPTDGRHDATLRVLTSELGAPHFIDGALQVRGGYRVTALKSGPGAGTVRSSIRGASVPVPANAVPRGIAIDADGNTVIGVPASPPDDGTAIVGQPIAPDGTLLPRTGTLIAATGNAQVISDDAGHLVGCAYRGKQVFLGTILRYESTNLYPACSLDAAGDSHVVMLILDQSGAGSTSYVVGSGVALGTPPGTTATIGAVAASPSGRAVVAGSFRGLPSATGFLQSYDPAVP